jgi:RNA polymerase sigma factor (sigma-70 family)
MSTLDPIKLYLASIKKLRPTTDEEVKKLIPRIRRRDRKAEKRMIEGNLRLVVSIAKKYYKSPLTFSDVIEEGNLGLMKAIEKYDPQKGYKFSTYATIWITQHISQYVSSQLRTIRVPEHVMARDRRCRKNIESLKQKLGRTPTTKEITRRFDFTESDITSAAENQEMSQGLSSLDIKIDDNEAIALLDILSDGGKNDPEKDTKEHKITEQIAAILHRLKPTERKVIVFRYGLSGKPPKTLEEVGTALHLSRERIRQVEKKAFNKIKQAVTQLRFQGKDEI